LAPSQSLRVPNEKSFKHSKVFASFFKKKAFLSEVCSLRTIALIRGINVGRAKRVAMAALRDALVRRGLARVETLLNSGNVVFDAADGVDAAAVVRAALAVDLGVVAGVAVLRGAGLADIVAGNLLGEVADASRLLVTVYAEAGDRARFMPLAAREWAPDRLLVGDGAVYAWCEAGAIASPLAQAVSRAMGPACTTRNWATLMKLAALAAG
jgi:uncharacterized protein (DUF1697 family)